MAITTPVIIAKNLDSDVVADFLNRLDAHEASADIYVPAEFDGVVKAGKYKIGSAHALVHVLEEMKEGRPRRGRRGRGRRRRRGRR